MIVRKPDWHSHLIAYVSKWANINEFTPGKFDCAIFTAGAVEAMTGVNLADKFGIEYTTLADGIKKLKAAGYSDHVEVVSDHFEEIEPAFSQPGDIAVVSGMIDNALGIVQGAGIYVIREAGGLGLVELKSAKRGFRVPYSEE